jgi:hypothetical protein
VPFSYYDPEEINLPTVMCACPDSWSDTFGSVPEIRRWVVKLKVPAHRAEPGFRQVFGGVGPRRRGSERHDGCHEMPAQTHFSLR